MSSISHRFTPPTCTLEITGKKSPLSRWTKQNIGQKLQFTLKFDDPREATANQVTIKGIQQDLVQLQNAVDFYVRENLQASFQLPSSPPKSPAIIAQSSEPTPYLESQGLVNHKLYFGNLLHDSKEDHLKLSTVQLFDLVTALAACQAEVAILPDTQQDAPARGKMLPLWGGIVAVAIVGVGITTILLPSLRTTQIADSPENQALRADNIPELDEIIPPQKPESSNQASSEPQLSEPLTSATRLPPPPAVDTPKPKPDIPDPADFPLGEVARQSGLANSSQSATTPETEVKVPQTTTTILPPNSLEQQEIVLPDNSNQEPPTQPPAESKLSIAEEPNQIETAINPASDDSNNLSTPQKEEPIVPTNSQLALGKVPAQLSQLEEVTAYFENQWQPPANLRQSLEYRLLLNSDGSIKKVIPLGKAARLYISQTKIPVNGEPFISPPTTTQSSKIRLLLNPDGRVQAFTE